MPRKKRPSAARRLIALVRKYPLRSVAAAALAALLTFQTAAKSLEWLSTFDWFERFRQSTCFPLLYSPHKSDPTSFGVGIAAFSAVDGSDPAGLSVSVADELAALMQDHILDTGIEVVRECLGAIPGSSASEREKAAEKLRADAGLDLIITGRIVGSTIYPELYVSAGSRAWEELGGLTDLGGGKSFSRDTADDVSAWLDQRIGSYVQFVRAIDALDIGMPGLALGYLEQAEKDWPAETMRFWNLWMGSVLLQLAQGPALVSKVGCPEVLGGPERTLLECAREAYARANGKGSKQQVRDWSRAWIGMGNVEVASAMVPIDFGRGTACGAYPQAIRSYEKAAELAAGEFDEAVELRARFYAGMTYAEWFFAGDCAEEMDEIAQDKLRASLNEVMSAHEDHQDDPLFHLLSSRAALALGRVQLEDGGIEDTEDAVRTLERVSEIAGLQGEPLPHQRDVSIRAQLYAGYARARLGQYDDALDDVNAVTEALDYEPLWTVEFGGAVKDEAIRMEAHVAAGLLHEKVGDQTGAEEHLVAAGELYEELATDPNRQRPLDLEQARHDACEMMRLACGDAPAAKASSAATHVYGEGGSLE